MRAVVALDFPTMDKPVEDACFPNLRSGLVSHRGST